MANKSITTPDNHLLDQAIGIIETARNEAYRHINDDLVKRNWLLGKLIA